MVQTATSNAVRPRRSSGIRTRASPPSRRSIAAGFDLPADGRGAPQATADRRETKRELAAALLVLTHAVRAAIVLRHVDGLSVAEAAEALGKPEGTIKAQVHRGLRELRAALEAEPESSPTPRTTMPVARLVPTLEAIR